VKAKGQPSGDIACRRDKAIPTSILSLPLLVSTMEAHIDTFSTNVGRSKCNPSVAFPLPFDV
jgi:hypothetical protein